VYYKTEILNSGNNIKLKWKIIKDIITKNKKRNHFENLIKLINDTTDIKKQNSILANQFNNYFANVASGRQGGKGGAFAPLENSSALSPATPPKKYVRYNIVIKHYF
jgi:hypothetical protein